GGPGLQEPLAGDEADPFRAEDLATGVRSPQNHVENRVQVRLWPREQMSLPRHADRRREEARPGQRRVATVRRLEPRERTRNTAGGSTDPEDLRGAPVELDVDRLHLAGRDVEPVTGNRHEEVVQAD